ncbi:hypothetical protein RDABS01_005685 [Bienertia sinuspersici]
MAILIMQLRFFNKFHHFYFYLESHHQSHTINGSSYQSLLLYNFMICSGVIPDKFTFPFVFKACAASSALEKGKEVHALAVKTGLLRACTELGSLKLGAWVHEYALKNGFELDIYLGTALIDMYSKCGSLDEARDVFNMMKRKSLATWNSMISSLGVHGCGEEAFAVFLKMMEEKVMPDSITFVGVLSACAQTQKVNEGLNIFKYMIEECGIVPVLEHYICMFELWGLAKVMQRRDEMNGKVLYRRLLSCLRQAGNIQKISAVGYWGMPITGIIVLGTNMVILSQKYYTDISCLWLQSASIDSMRYTMPLEAEIITPMMD